MEIVINSADLVGPILAACGMATIVGVARYLLAGGESSPLAIWLDYSFRRSQAESVEKLETARMAHNVFVVQTRDQLSVVSAKGMTDGAVGVSPAQGGHAVGAASSDMQ